MEDWIRFYGRRLGGNFSRTHMEERTSFYDGKAGRLGRIIDFPYRSNRRILEVEERTLFIEERFFPKEEYER